MKIFVVIPAFNEEKRIGQVLADLSSLDYNVVVVDDGSTDNTSQIVQPYAVKLLRHKVNRGQGASLQTGNEYALKNEADLIIHFDADGQFLVAEIKDLIEPILKQEADIVFGSRFLSKQSKIPWFKKYIIFRVAKIINRVFFGIKLTDPQSGFRALSRETAQRITIDQDNYAHCNEIASKAFAEQLRIKEVPMTVIYHQFGVGLSGGVKILKDLIFSKLLK